MSEAKLCPMLKVGVVMHQAAARGILDPEPDHATFLPCVQEKCEWWVAPVQVDGVPSWKVWQGKVQEVKTKDGTIAAYVYPGHCAVRMG